jgi:RNA polymerase sigma-70 factor (ECF subfamily)
VNARSNTIDEIAPPDAASAFDALFHAHHARITRVIARVIRDPGRAEEIAVDTFWKLWRNPKAQREQAGGWLYRAAVRLSLNELRRQLRSSRREELNVDLRKPPDPEQVRAATEEQEHVRTVLAALKQQQAELLLLRSSGLSYDELAAALELNPSSVGTLLSRAQQAFRKEYVQRYGEQSDAKR